MILERRHARVEGVAGACEHIERPQRSTVYRPLGSAKASWCRNAGRSEDRATRAELLREGIWVQLVHARVRVSVRRDFVSRIQDAPQQRRVVFGNPPEHENVPRTPQLSRSANMSFVVATTRLGSSSQCDTDSAPPTPQISKPLFDVNGQTVPYHGTHTPAEGAR